MTHRFARGEVDLCHADIVRTPSSTGFLDSATSRRIGLDINRDSRSTRSVPVRGAANVRVRVRVRVRIRVRVRVRAGAGARARVRVRARPSQRASLYGPLMP